MTVGFRYRAATREGQVVEGVVQAASQRTALEELRRQTLYPIELAPLAETRRAAPRGSPGRAPALAFVARTVATMLSAGVALDRALAFAAEQVRHPEVAEAARHVHAEVRTGASLAQAMAGRPRVFGALFVALVLAGEESGALDESMARIADHLDELVELRAQIRASLLYPALMAIASGVGTIILLLFVVPRFLVMLEEVGGALPLSTRLLVGASSVIVDGWWLLLLVGVLFALALRAWLARPENRRRWHAWRITWPLTGELELDYMTARFTRALGMLLRSSRPILPSLRVARAAVGNTALGEALDRAAEDVSHGKRLAAALSGSLPPLATEMIAVGEESGRLDDLCLRVADSYDHSVRRTLRTLVGVIEPTLILLFALIVGFIALAMLQAIYGINASVL
ncbi:MAG: type II secretion system F family protein [Gemmatimonadetes bacterium]|nr:type II secretion system F family protein [Gemmatimonadota bacterium]